MSDDEAYAAFRAVRFAENGGEPFCPHCGGDAVYEYRARKLFKCKACEKQFSVTSGTIFRSYKKPFQVYLTAILLFVNGVNGHSASRLSRDLCVAYKTAFVLLHKLRRAMGTVQIDNKLTGTVEIDGVYIGGHIRLENIKLDRKGKGRQYNAKRRTIVTMRERRPGGRSRALVTKGEKYSAPYIAETIHPSADVITDDASTWGKLGLHFNSHETVNHSIGSVIDGIHINPLEAQHMRIRRGERGVYLHISGAHAQRYAHEFSWRDDHRRVSNGRQYQLVLGVVARAAPDHEFVGYWGKRPDELQPRIRAKRLRQITRKRRRSQEWRRNQSPSTGAS